jgi:AAA domain
MTKPDAAYEQSDWERAQHASIERTRAENKEQEEFRLLQRDPGLAFEEANLRWLAELKRTDLPSYHSVRGLYQRAGISTWDLDKAVDQIGKPNGAAAPTLVAAKAFVDGYQAPEYAVDGLIQRGRFYTLTGATGHGKTSVALCLAVHLALGKALNGNRVEQGNILYLAAEGPEDAKARMILMADRLSLDLSRLPVYFVEGGFNLSDWSRHIRAEVERIGGAIATFIDTGPAFQHACGFADENDNMQALNFALMLREFTRLPGQPAVIVPTHPTKNAGKDNLLPRGGSALLNETDGNLTLWAEGERETTELHWAGKLRGPSFDPLVFALEKGTCPGLVDAKGRQIPSVWACLSDQRRAERAASRQREDEDALLIVMLEAPDHSLSTWAEHLGWLSGSGDPLKSRVHRALERLKRDRLADQNRGRWIITKKGKDEAERLKRQAQ